MPGLFRHEVCLRDALHRIWLTVRTENNYDISYFCLSFHGKEAFWRKAFTAPIKLLVISTGHMIFRA